MPPLSREGSPDYIQQATGRIGSNALIRSDSYFSYPSPPLEQLDNSAIPEADWSPCPSPVSSLRDEILQCYESGPQVTTNVCSQTPDIENDAPQVEQAIYEKRSLCQEMSEWRKELIASIFLVVALFAIVGTAYPFQGKPRPQLPIKISVNALLSVYAVVFKTALVSIVTSAISQTQWSWFATERSLYDVHRYDKAARDSWGSLKWLGAHGVRQPLVALGATIFAVSIAIDPFIQQLISYHDCTTKFNTRFVNATIPRTNFFNPPMQHALGPSDAFPGLNEQSAFTSGILSPPSLPISSVSFDCQTGNCTFKTEYSTVGYCSYCEDISDQLNFREECDDSGCCHISELPSGLQTSSRQMTGNYNLLAMGTAVEGTWEILAAMVIGSKDGEPAMDCDNPANNNTWSCRGNGAASCSLSPCVRTYKSFGANGRLEETIIDHSDPRIEWGFPKGLIKNGESKSFIRGMVDTHCISTVERTSLEELGYKFDLQSRWLPYNLTFDAQFNFNTSVPSSAPFPQSLLTNKCLYMINNRFVSGFLRYYLVPFLNGTLEANIVPASVKSFANWKGPQVLQQFYNFSSIDLDSIETLFQRGSDSLTNYIRENGQSGYSDSASGVVNHYATCLHIEWAWIALPATLAIGVMLLLLLTIISAANSKAPIWRSSLLAYIFHGPAGADWYFKPRLGSSGQEPQQATNMMKAMEDLSRKTTVKLDRAGPLIRLGKVDQANGCGRSFISNTTLISGDIQLEEISRN